MKKHTKERNLNWVTKVVSYLYEKLRKKDQRNIFIKRQVIKDLQVLERIDPDQKIKDFYVKKLKQIFILIMAGIFIGGMIWINHQISGEILNGKEIMRNDYDGLEKNIPLEVQIGNTVEEYDFEVQEKKYTKEQLFVLYNEAIPKLDTLVLGMNKDYENITSDLNLVSEVQGYPFEISWECQDYTLLQPGGEIRMENVKEEGNVTSVFADLKYEDFVVRYTINVVIYQPAMTAEDITKNKIQEKLKRIEEETRYSSRFELPTEVDGIKLCWRERRENTIGLFLLFLTLACIMIYFLQDYDLHQKVKERTIQMQRDYPNVVSKLSVYMGAGMTMRTAWEKIVWNYENNAAEFHNRFVYEEMKLTVREMQSGISEVLAYDHFGRRNQSQTYVKFAALIIQNLKKGNSSLLRILREEAELAFENRKNMARKYGEEISSKLLLPMILQFCVVMIMIMVPAFLTF